MERPKLVKKEIADQQRAREGEIEALLQKEEDREEFSKNEIDEIERLAKIAKERLSKNKIQEENFKSLDPETAKRIAYVKQRREQMKQASQQEEDTKVGTVKALYKAKTELIKELSGLMEAVVFESIETHGWLGSNMKAKPASEYDDIANGIDIITFEIQNGVANRQTALATDETTSERSAVNKLSGIVAEIKRGELKQTKYLEYTDDRGQTKREINVKTPRVVITLTRRGVLALARDCFGGNPLETIQKMRAHGGQFAIREQIIAQLKAFSQLAEKEGKKELAHLYRDRLNAIRQPENLEELLKNPETKRQYTVFKNNPAHRELLVEVEKINTPKKQEERFRSVKH